MKDNTIVLDKDNITAFILNLKPIRKPKPRIKLEATCGPTWQELWDEIDNGGKNDTSK